MSLSGRDFIRYSRQIMLADVGEAGQEQLLDSRVLLVGLGGLGCPAALYLAGAGVGHLALCDPDIVELTNLQRQILYRGEDCDRPKVEAARDALLALNPGVSLRGWQRGIDDQVWKEAGPFDLVLDCTDNMPARHWLNRRCRETGTPLVSAAALGWEGQVVTLDFAHQSSPCLACAIPEDAPEPAATCATAGVSGPVLGTMGSLQAVAALRLLLGKPVKHAALRRYHGDRDQWLDMTIAAEPGCPVCQSL